MATFRVKFSELRQGVGGCAGLLRVEVMSSEDSACKIFVMHQSPPDARGNLISEFDHVATSTDLHEIPEDAATATIPWYRTDKCEILLRSEADLELAKQLFTDDIGALSKSLGTISDVNSSASQTVVEFSPQGTVVTESSDVDVDHGPADNYDKFKDRVDTLDADTSSIKEVINAIKGDN